jgi:hypothetical protein
MIDVFIPSPTRYRAKQKQTYETSICVKVSLKRLQNRGCFSSLPSLLAADPPPESERERERERGRGGAQAATGSSWPNPPPFLPGRPPARPPWPGTLPPSSHSFWRANQARQAAVQTEFASAAAAAAVQTTTRKTEVLLGAERKDEHDVTGRIHGRRKSD